MHLYVTTRSPHHVRISRQLDVQAPEGPVGSTDQLWDYEVVEVSSCIIIHCHSLSFIINSGTTKSSRYAQDSAGVLLLGMQSVCYYWVGRSLDRKSENMH